MGSFKKTNSKCFKSILTIGILVILVSIGAFIYGEAFFIKRVTKELYEAMVIKPNSTRFGFWSRPPVKVFRKYYFFNVENPEEVILGAKPNLTEHGPYVYSQILEKRNIEFLDQMTVKYSPVVTLHYEPELSVGPENDVVTILNVPLVSTIDKITKMPGNLPANILFGYFETNLFISRSVQDIISGYYDPLMHLAKETYPDKVKDDKFGLLLEKNGTEWQEFIIKTGADDPKLAGNILSWNGKKKLDFWTTDKANEMRGSDGSFNPIFLTREHKLVNFNSELCRSYTMTYLKDNNVDGIDCFDFHLPENIFANETLNPENAGFCDGECLGNGVFNLSRCLDGVSSFISQPHFLNADLKFLEGVNGLNPDKNKHDFILHFEPISGTSIGGKARLQVNFYVSQNKNIDLVKHIESVLFPFFWFEESVELQPIIKDKLYILSIINKCIKIIPFMILLIGLLCIFCSMFPLFGKYLNKRRRRSFKKYKLAAQQSSASILETVSFKQSSSPINI
ncbi:unnamed protein product [Brachionus calyciflorus]|uniref:Scavenger receptor class B member 1 n=1 Tax=Brachionus calyciflorus TaxID=104777 RepID=A0A814AV00_9BILA|nr:unnamed protein product [Brachionus calyciflorus]